MSPEKQAVKGVTINDSFKFRSAAEQNEARRKALAGNAEAAKRLGDLSLFVENNIVEAKRWYRLAASFGDKDAKESLRTLENLDRE